MSFDGCDCSDCNQLGTSLKDLVTGRASDHCDTPSAGLAKLGSGSDVSLGPLEVTTERHRLQMHVGFRIQVVRVEINSKREQQDQYMSQLDSV